MFLYRKNNLNEKIKIVAVMAMITMLFTACGTSKIVGRWQSFDGSERIEFFSDGTYTSDDVNYQGNYSVDGNRVKLEEILMPDMVREFKVSRDTLTIYDDSGNVVEEYNRVN